MKCFYCKQEACAKVGSAQGNILKALFPFFGKSWSKSERYVCRKHFEELVK